MALVIVFNTTDNNIRRDEEGHAVEPQSYGIADDTYVAEHVNAGRLVVIDPGVINQERSSGAAIMVKQEFDRLNPVKSTKKK